MTIVTEIPTPSEQQPADAGENQSVPPPLRVRYRIRFAKVGLLRWTSHRDLARLWERLVRRAALKLSMTEGFHPKPRIGFPSALALGVEGLDEVVELELAERLSPAELLTRIQNDNQPGLSIASVQLLPDGFGKAQLKQSDYLITVIESADLDAVQQAIDRLKSQDAVSVQRKDKTLHASIATQVPELAVRDGNLQLSLAASDSASLRANDILDLLGLGDWIEQGATITRTRVLLHSEFQSNDSQFVALAQTNISGQSVITEHSDA